MLVSFLLLFDFSHINNNNNDNECFFFLFNNFYDFHFNVFSFCFVHFFFTYILSLTHSNDLSSWLSSSLSDRCGDLAIKISREEEQEEKKNRTREKKHRKVSCFNEKKNPIKKISTENKNVK